MVNGVQFHRLTEEGVKAWNVWRSGAGADRLLFLSSNELRSAALSMNGELLHDLLGIVDLREANLCGADLSQANLSRTDLTGCKLSKANLSRADLRWTILRGADLADANLDAALLGRADLTGANLSGADFREARLTETTLSNIDFGGCRNLHSVIHFGPSFIDLQTLQRSDHLPLAFLRGVGLPDTVIEYLPSLLKEAIQHYSCFISYSSRDEEFVRRLHADLQDRGVRCWFAPEDMKIGAKIRDTIDEAIRLRDKVLLVLSAASIASDWVEDEVDKAFEEERQRGRVVLFPVRLDDVVLTSTKAWATKLRRSRNVGDFREWKNHDAYQRALERVLRDLAVKSS